MRYINLGLDNITVGDGKIIYTSFSWKADGPDDYETVSVERAQLLIMRHIDKTREGIAELEKKFNESKQHLLKNIEECERFSCELPLMIQKTSSESC